MFLFYLFFLFFGGFFSLFLGIVVFCLFVFWFFLYLFIFINSFFFLQLLLVEGRGVYLVPSVCVCFFNFPFVGGKAILFCMWVR